MSTTLGGEHAELLSRLELFRGLDRVTLAKLTAHLELVRLSAGEVLFGQGDAADGLYLVSRGSFGVYATGALLGPLVGAAGGGGPSSWLLVGLPAALGFLVVALRTTSLGPTRAGSEEGRDG